MDPLKKEKEKSKQSGASAALLLSTIVTWGAIEFKNHPEKFDVSCFNKKPSVYPFPSLICTLK